MPSAATATDFGLPITPEQRKALFALAKARDWSIDDLRALTPGGSISRMTRLQASRLLDSLNAGTRHAHKAYATDSGRAASEDGTQRGGTPRRSRTPRRPTGVYAIATSAQRNKIEALRIELGWTTDGLSGFLHDRRHADGGRMTRIDSTADAAAVIELLKAVLAKHCQAQARRASEQGNEASRQDRREGPLAALSATDGTLPALESADNSPARFASAPDHDPSPVRFAGVSDRDSSQHHPAVESDSTAVR